VDERIETMGGRVTELETAVNQAKGAGKASLGILTQLLTILALVLMIAQWIESRPAAKVHQAEAAAQHSGAAK
jgi:hypothetical protein